MRVGQVVQIQRVRRPERVRHPMQIRRAQPWRSSGKGATKKRPRQHRGGDNRATKHDQVRPSPQRHIRGGILAGSIVFGQRLGVELSHQLMEEPIQHPVLKLDRPVLPVLAFQRR